MPRAKWAALSTADFGGFMSNHADNISTRPDAEPKPVGSVATGEGVIGFAVLGMMLAGTIGLVHA